MKCDRYGCRGTCRQGRDCEDSLRSTRRMFGLEDEQHEEWHDSPVFWGLLFIFAMFIVIGTA